MARNRASAARSRGSRGLARLWDIPLDVVPTVVYFVSMSESSNAKGLYRLRPDSKGRITLGKLADGVSSYRARRQADGKIVLEPFIEIPADERWLYENR